MTAATLFSGIGAPEQAMPDWQWLWHAEIENFPSAVMAARHPGLVNLGDVTADDFIARAAALGRPDVLVFGSPCQSYSVAGQRLGLADPRGNLALVALGIVARLRPPWFVFENVPGLLSSRDGSDFGLLLRTMDDLGYHVAWRVLDAQFFGLAQRRKRVFVVGHAHDWRYPAAVLLEPESLSGHSPTREEAGERIAPTLEGRAGRSGANNFATGGGLSEVTRALRADGFDASEDGTGRGTPLVAFNHQASIAQGMRVSEETIDPLRRGQTPAVMTLALRGRDGGGTAELGGDCATALRSSQGGGDKPHVFAPTMGVRRLMPVECERFRGFPDGHTDVLYRGKPAKDGPRYKAIGNSMAVPVIRWILSRMEYLEHLTAERNEKTA